jgi:hypothetical protein
MGDWGLRAINRALDSLLKPNLPDEPFLGWPENRMAGMLLRLTLATADARLWARVWRSPLMVPREDNRI